MILAWIRRENSESKKRWRQDRIEQGSTSSSEDLRDLVVSWGKKVSVPVRAVAAKEFWRTVRAVRVSSQLKNLKKTFLL